MDIAIVIVSWNTRELLKKCLYSLQRELESLGASYETYVVDNNSADSSAEMVRQEFPRVRFFANQENLGFAAANNQVLSTVSARQYLLLNPDTKIVPGALHVLREFLKGNPQIGVAAPQLLNRDGSIQRSCRSFPTLAGMALELTGLSRLFPHAKASNYKMMDFDHTYARQVDQPEGACLLVRKEVFDQVGLFDEHFFMLFEEVDWCYRVMQAGWKIWFVPQAKVIHFYGQSIKQVKAKMIYHSHRGFFRYLMKHSTQPLIKLFSPIIFIGLMVLAAVRIVHYRFKMAAAHSN
jgi:GT2 family glycosyltransferase